jgi:hypothetical protein
MWHGFSAWQVAALAAVAQTVVCMLAVLAVTGAPEPTFSLLVPLGGEGIFLLIFLGLGEIGGDIEAP